MLIVLALVKLLITTLCLATGWKGGYIFPTMFAGTALGLAAHLIFPDIPMAVAVAGRHDGRRDGRHHESAHFLGVVCHGVGAARNVARDRHRRHRRRVSDGTPVDGLGACQDCVGIDTQVDPRRTRGFAPTGSAPTMNVSQESA